MERQQQRQRAKQPHPSNPARSNQARTAKATLTGTPVWKHPLAILGSVWVGIVLVALTAVNGLLSPDSSDGNRKTGAAIVHDTATTTQAAKRQSRLPLWLFGAIALSCAAGSILVSKQVNRPPRPFKSTRLKRLTTPALDAIEAPVSSVPQPLSVSPLSVSQPQPYAMNVPSFALVPHHTQPSPTAAAPFMAPTTLMQLAQQVSRPTTGNTDVSVTIVPSEESHPLDWGEASLADKLDLRKQRSISSLL